MGVRLGAGRPRYQALRLPAVGHEDRFDDKRARGHLGGHHRHHDARRRHGVTVCCSRLPGDRSHDQPPRGGRVWDKRVAAAALVAAVAAAVAASAVAATLAAAVATTAVAAALAAAVSTAAVAAVASAVAAAVAAVAAAAAAVSTAAFSAEQFLP